MVSKPQKGASKELSDPRTSEVGSLFSPQVPPAFGAGRRLAGLGRRRLHRAVPLLQRLADRRRPPRGRGKRAQGRRAVWNTEENPPPLVRCFVFWFAFWLVPFLFFFWGGGGGGVGWNRKNAPLFWCFFALCLFCFAR